MHTAKGLFVNSGLKSLKLSNIGTFELRNPVRYLKEGELFMNFSQ